MPTLDWIGKEAVRQHHREVPFHLLREVPDGGAGDPDAGNLLVQGDNLVALKALLPTHAGTVKCVYIDPPYNTGNEGWVYNDNVNSPAIRAWLDRAVGKEAEDLGRHDKWLCMMYPRLVLLRELLAEDGSLWMSLDDNEVHHARSMLDEVFGAQCFVADVIWEKADSPRMDAKLFSVRHDHTLVVAKNPEVWSVNRLKADLSDLPSHYNKTTDDGRIYYLKPLRAMGGEGDSREARPNLYYAIQSPDGTEVYPVRSDGSDGAWRWGEPKVTAESDRIEWVNGDNGWAPYYRIYADSGSGRPPETIWPHAEVGSNRTSKAELNEIVDSTGSFNTPKPLALLQRILEVATDPGDLVLDSFAGSGTTGHAVLKQNAEDGGDRRFILVEMEDDVARPVTAERLRRAVGGYPYKGKDRTELYRQKVTVTSFKKGTDHYAKAQAIKEAREGDFDAFEQKIEKGHFVLYGVKTVEAKKEGLGGGFRFFEIGEPVYDADGRLNDAVPHDALGRYAYYAQTGRPLGGDAQAPPLVGVAADGTAVYLLGGPGAGDGAAPSGVLDREALAALPAHDGPRVVWGTACRLGADVLDAHGVTFRQVPYDLQTP